MSAPRRAAAALAALLAAASAGADVFLAGDIRLSRGETPGSYRLSAVLPAGIAGEAPLGWPGACAQTGFERAAHRDGEQVTYHAVCARPPGPGDHIATGWQLDAARLQSALAPNSPVTTLLPEAGRIRIPFDTGPAADRGWRQLAPAMTWQGMLHIWLGWDHLAFVLCLCMLARGWPLLGLATAFTLGHSLSLGLAFFGVLSIPVPPTEALIALSIVLVAREALLAGAGEPDPGSKARAAIVVVIFGLVHGLGFASALGELGISAGERWPALLFFNLGVELGQIAFVAAVLAAFAALRALAIDGPARRLALGAAGVIGGFWLVERVAGF